MGGRRETLGPSVELIEIRSEIVAKSHATLVVKANECGAKNLGGHAAERHAERGPRQALIRVTGSRPRVTGGGFLIQRARTRWVASSIGTVSVTR